MDDRPPPPRQVWRPQFARNRNLRDSNASVDDQMSDTSEGGCRSRSPHGRRGGGSKAYRRNPSGSGRLGDLRDQLNMSRAASMEYSNSMPTSPRQLAENLSTDQRPQEAWQFQGRRRGQGQSEPWRSSRSNWRGSQDNISSGPNGQNWRGSQSNIPSGPNGQNWRGSQNNISSGPSGPHWRGSQDHGSSGSNGPPSHQISQGHDVDRSQSRRGGRHNSNRKWNNRSLVITKLETKDDWTNLSNLDNSLRIVTKLQDLESSWVKFFHSDADFDVLDLAFDIFTSIDLKYRYAKLALMKSLFTNKFIERLVQLVEKFKTSWFQVGKEKVLSFVEKLRTNVEFVLSNDAAFHDNASSKAAIGLLIDGCVRTLEHINNKLMDLQGSADTAIGQEILHIRELSAIKFIEMQILDESIHPDDFRDRYEVMANIVHGAYQSDDHYIQTHFSLLKEDFQSVLREGVEQYLLDPKKKNFSIWAYENVLVKRFDPTQKFLQDRKIDNRKLFFKVTFPECKYFSKIQWKYVKRFMFGSLVVLTSDKFKSYYLALIEERFFDQPDAISIVISFVYSPPKGVEDQKYLLVEPKVFYEPYLNSMKVLKHMAKIGLPMKKYIVNGDTNPANPAYLNPESTYRIASYDIKVNNILSWPKAEDLGLNRTQKEAFVSALTSEMALIQGPPGTGKTFLAFKIIETLLKNRKNSYVDGPIMIVCYKNHSLDQILEGLLIQGKRVVRIGGQSKVKALKWERNVRSLPAPPTISSLLSEKYNLEQKLRKCLADIKRAVSLICFIKAGIGILNLELLRGFQIIPPEAEWPVDMWLLELFEEAPQMTPESIRIQWNNIRQTSGIQGFLDEESLSEVFHSNLISIGKELIDYGMFLSKLEEHVDYNEELQDTFWEMNERYWSAYNRYTYLLEGLSFTVDPSDCPDDTAQDFDYFQLGLEERWALYRKWESDLVKKLEARIVDLQNQVPETEENLSEYEEMVMSQTLKYEQPQVIGVTTSGATKHYSALADVGAKVVLVEEAAEVLEAHVIASLSTKCQHLVLIGDHQQLKPNTASFEIGSRYRMNVSLFERMINNEIKLSCLATQHRMRPEIAALICPAIYKNLENHPSVQDYPDVIGTKKNVYFFNHDHLEQVGYDSDSKYNSGEGDMLLAIAYYLIRQGYKPEQITILSTYLEQDRYIKKAIDKHYAGTMLKQVFCTVVDNYQGEENIIILLSLVRSNQNGDVGFLSTKNRVCVALSRAKHGLFIFGNMTCLSKKEPTIWSEINAVLIGQEAISTRFPLKCVRHGNVTEVASRQELEALKHAGCLNPCDAPLTCGHTCKVMCHGQDQEHVELFMCREKCMQRCRNGHTCEAPCRDTCPPCPFMMPTLLVCGHSRQLECHKANLQAFCKETVEIKLEKCGHNQLVLCKLTEQSERHKIVCRSDCKQNFKCGHVCKRTCHVSDDPDHKTKFLCEEPCELINKSCPRKHRCKKKCREPCGDCLVKIEKILPCDHKAEMKCCDNVNGFVCHQDCERKLPCGHDCKNECCDPCGPCKIKVEKVIQECGHSIHFKCSDTATRSHCKQPCQTIKLCGHPCTGMCKEICEELICGSQVRVTLPCGHEASVLCGDVTRNRYAFTTECKAPCQAKLPCGHRCKGTCGNCLEGSVHIPCDEICNKPLFCIHNCKTRCNDSLHSCSYTKCFNTCWQNELKNLPGGPRPTRNKKKLKDFDPKKRMVFEIRNELRNLNDQMGRVARSYNGNKTVMQCVKKIQLFVNKSRTITKYDEELPILKTCLFKVEFISVMFKIMMRLGMMKLPDAKKLEVENFLEKLVVRSASNPLMGIYEMNQLKEQVIRISLVLDVHNVAEILGPRNDSDFTDSMLSSLNETKSSFGPNQRALIWQMLRDYRDRMTINLPLTDVDMEGLFQSTDKFCKPICHHRIDLVLEPSQKEEQERVEALRLRQLSNDRKNGVQDVTESTSGGTRSLVSEEYDEEVAPKKARNAKKLPKHASNDADEKMDVEEVSVASKTVSDIVKEKSQHIAADVPASPYSEASDLLSQMVIEPNQQSSQMISGLDDQPQEASAKGDRNDSNQIDVSHVINVIQTKAKVIQAIQSIDPNNQSSGDSCNDLSELIARASCAAHQSIPSTGQLDWSLIELVDSTAKSLDKQPNGNKDDERVNMSSATVGHVSSPNRQVQSRGHVVPTSQHGQVHAEEAVQSMHCQFSQFALQPGQVKSVLSAGTSRSNAEPAASSSGLNPFTAQTVRNLTRPNTLLDEVDEPEWDIIEPDAEASVYIDEID